VRFDLQSTTDQRANLRAEKSALSACMLMP